MRVLLRLRAPATFLGLLEAVAPRRAEPSRENVKPVGRRGEQLDFKQNDDILCRTILKSPPPTPRDADVLRENCCLPASSARDSERETTLRNGYSCRELKFR